MAAVKPRAWTSFTTAARNPVLPLAQAWGFALTLAEEPSLKGAPTFRGRHETRDLMPAAN